MIAVRSNSFLRTFVPRSVHGSLRRLAIHEDSHGLDLAPALLPNRACTDFSRAAC